MQIKTIILNSESQFRKYVMQNLNDISQIVVFEDILDHTIFFYCFQDDSIIATKEHASKDFSSYKKIYVQLTSELKFNVVNKPNQLKTLKLIK